MEINKKWPPSFDSAPERFHKRRPQSRLLNEGLLTDHEIFLAVRRGILKRVKEERISVNTGMHFR